MIVPAAHIAAEVLSGGNAKTTGVRGNVEKVVDKERVMIRFGSQMVNVRVPPGSLREGDTVRVLSQGNEMILIKQDGHAQPGARADQWSSPSHAALLNTLSGIAEKLTSHGDKPPPEEQLKQLSGVLQSALPRMSGEIADELRAVVAAVAEPGKTSAEIAQVIDQALERIEPLVQKTPPPVVLLSTDTVNVPGFVHFESSADARAWLESVGAQLPQSEPALSASGLSADVVVQVVAKEPGVFQAFVMSPERVFTELMHILGESKFSQQDMVLLSNAISRALKDRGSIGQEQLLDALKGMPESVARHSILPQRVSEDALHQWFLNALDKNNAAMAYRGANPLTPSTDLPHALQYLSGLVDMLPETSRQRVESVVGAMKDALDMGGNRFDVRRAAEVLGLTLEKTLASGALSKDVALSSVKAALLEVAHQVSELSRSMQGAIDFVDNEGRMSNATETAFGSPDGARSMREASERIMAASQQASVLAREGLARGFSEESFDLREFQSWSSTLSDRISTLSRALAELAGTPPSAEPTENALRMIAGKLLEVTGEIARRIQDLPPSSTKELRVLELEIRRIAEHLGGDRQSRGDEVRATLPRNLAMEVIQGNVEKNLTKLEMFQTLARPVQTSEGSQQILALPVRVDGEWSEMHCRLTKRKGRGNRKGGSAKYGVNLHTAPSALGEVGVSIEYTPKKAFRLSMEFGSDTAKDWFEQHKAEFTSALSALGLRGVSVNLKAKREREHAQGPRSSGTADDRSIDIHI